MAVSTEPNIDRAPHRVGFKGSPRSHPFWPAPANSCAWPETGGAHSGSLDIDLRQWAAAARLEWKKKNFVVEGCDENVIPAGINVAESDPERVIK